MNKSAEYRAKVQHCCDMARSDPEASDKYAWLILGYAWLSLYEQHELIQRSAASQQDLQIDLGEDPDTSRVRPFSLSQFSLVDRDHRLTSEETLPLAIASLAR